MSTFPIIILGFALVTHAVQSFHSSDDSDGQMKKLGLRFLALGDSYTIGEGVSAPERWPAILTGMLRAEGIPVSDPLIIAKTGWTTDELESAILREKPEGTFSLVSLLIGVNNQYRGRNAEEYRNEFRALLSRAIVFAGGKADHVVVVSIPDWGVTPFAEGKDRLQIERAIDLFNEVNKEESLRQQVNYIDITGQSRGLKNDGSFLASDGLHPSGKMYEAWAKEILPAILPTLQRTLE